MSIVLGIESSCDETAIAVVEDGKHVLSSLVSSQISVHEVYGGVVPEIAAREHLKAISPMFDAALAEAKITSEDIDLIAVTQGPGLIGCLLVGVSFAKGLACSLRKPLIPVDHVHAHLHGALLGIADSNQLAPSQQVFPCLAMVVSGGHTNLYYMEDELNFNLFATTIDDACGECFDKVAKLLGFSYPGGPKIEKAASKGNSDRFSMPRMVQEKSRMEFSYSGLKTHMVNLKNKHGEFVEQDLYDVCASFQQEALGQLIRKIKFAYQKYPKAKSLIVAGGVAANSYFRDLVNKEIDLPAFFPGLAYCSDNAAMIASLGWHEYRAAQNCERFMEDQDWDAYSRYKFELYFQRN
ncbi:MAG: tRNA (adenosine(37)-N6)-threonylcarbamoyltransferase complex transferase subunit TsaD [Bdellovibrionota bacterium]